MTKPLIAGGVLLVGACMGASFAQNYPIKPIRIIVPFTPGGGNDISARFIAQQLTQIFGQQVVVENRPGAGSTVGTDMVAKSAPDGYTLMVIHNAIAINQTLYPKLPYDALRDFAQVAMVGVTTNTLVVHPSLPVKSTKDLIALARAKAGSLNYASTGAGGTSHLAMEYFRLATATNIVHIPYKGTAPALTDMVAGQTQVMISALPGTVPFINAKRLIALATSGNKRSVFLPVKVPREIIMRLNGAIVKSLANADVKQQLANQGIEVSSMTPEEFTQYVRSEIDKMGRIIKASGAKPE